MFIEYKSHSKEEKKLGKKFKYFNFSKYLVKIYKNLNFKN